MTARLVSSSNNKNTNSSNNSNSVSLVSSRPSEGRRANKPLMEKRRRARINQSLAVLKTLILDSARLEQNTKHSKLEKADILELTVRHLQRQRTLGSAVLNKYRAGFQECTREVSRFLESPDLALTPGAPTPALDPTIKQRLLRHLDTCVAELDLDIGLSSSAEGKRDAVKAEADSEARPDSSTTTGGDENNNGAPSSVGGKTTPQPTGTVGTPEPDMEPVTAVATTSSPSAASPNMLSVVQVIPSRLPDGQVVFLLPSHYVQLAAAAAASSEVGSPAPSSTTTLWAMSNNKVCIDNNAGIVAIEESIDTESLSDQPIDFTVAKRNDDGMQAGEVKEEGPVWRPW